jgi:hypothetical protein
MKDSRDLSALMTNLDIQDSRSYQNGFDVIRTRIRQNRRVGRADDPQPIAMAATSEPSSSTLPAAPNLSPSIYYYQCKDIPTCLICLEQPRDAVFHPCNHVATCRRCRIVITPQCAVCRSRLDIVVPLTLMSNPKCGKCGEMKDVMYIPCRHVSSCHACDQLEKSCPICTKKKWRHENRWRIYWS